MKFSRPRSLRGLLRLEDAIQDVEIIQGRTADVAALGRLLTNSYPRLLAADYPASVLAEVLPRITKAQPQLVTCGTYFMALQHDMLVDPVDGCAA